jgi:hypothetical protein
VNGVQPDSLGRAAHAPGAEADQAATIDRGADWSGDSLTPAPESLDAAIIFAAAGELVPAALKAVRPGGHGGLRRHPHERHPKLPLLRPVG